MRLTTKNSRTDSIGQNGGEGEHYDDNRWDINGKPPMDWMSFDQSMKKDKGKVRLDLLSVSAMNGTAEVLAFGAEKYEERGWEKGMEYSRVYGALLRHMTTWWAGEDLDEETKLSHLHHASCCIMFLQTYVEENMHSFDARPTVLEWQKETNFHGRRC